MPAGLLVVLCMSSSPYVYEPAGTASASPPAITLGAFYEHLILAAGGERSSSASGAVGELALLLPIDHEGTGIGGGARLGADTDRDTRLAVFARLRAGQGRERVSTYVEVDVGARLEPLAAAFVRVGFGGQLRLAGALSAFAGAGASIGVGGRLAASGDAGMGLRLDI